MVLYLQGAVCAEEKGGNVHQVYWRFFGGLNDFLPRERRHQRFSQGLKPGQVSFGKGAEGEGFRFGQTIKDAFEAIGVPHPEVAFMRVNGQAVDFSHQLAPGDEVQVYPHHQVPIHTADEARMPFLPGGKPSFVLDVHLGALVRYMRLAGFDCLYSATDPGDARIAELACEQQRVVLTRDVGLLKRTRVIWGYRLRNVQPKAQFREVVDYFQLKHWFDPFNRCSICNSEELLPLNRVQALSFMPEGVPKTVDELWRCRVCGKIYWQGSHYDGIQRFMETV